MQSLERAFSVLEAVAERPAGVTALAARLDLPKSTVARLLGSLERVGAVERLDRTRWQVGEAVARLAGTVSPERSLAALARPILAELVGALGEDVGLSVPDGDSVLYIDQAVSDHAVQVRDWTGTRAPLHAVPSGLVLLADRPTADIDEYVAQPLVALTPRTVVDAEALRARLDEVRALGYAWGLEEFAEGINSVAAPVRDSGGRAVAAIHAHGPAYRFPARRAKASAAAVVASAHALERRLARDERY